jgi:hypothetical protein
MVWYLRTPLPLQFSGPFLCMLCWLYVKFCRCNLKKSKTSLLIGCCVLVHCLIEKLARGLTLPCRLGLSVTSSECAVAWSERIPVNIIFTLTSDMCTFLNFGEPEDFHWWLHYNEKFKFHYQCCNSWYFHYLELCEKYWNKFLSTVDSDYESTFLEQFLHNLLHIYVNYNSVTISFYFFKCHAFSLCTFSINPTISFAHSTFLWVMKHFCYPHHLISTSCGSHSPWHGMSLVYRWRIWPLYMVGSHEYIE